MFNKIVFKVMVYVMLFAMLSSVLLYAIDWMFW